MIKTFSSNVHSNAGSILEVCFRVQNLVLSNNGSAFMSCKCMTKKRKPFIVTFNCKNSNERTTCKKYLTVMLRWMTAIYYDKSSPKMIEYWLYFAIAIVITLNNPQCAPTLKWRVMHINCKKSQQTAINTFGKMCHMFYSHFHAWLMAWNVVRSCRYDLSDVI